MRFAVMLLILAAASTTSGGVRAAEPAPERPAHFAEQVIVRAEDFVQRGEMPYLAFPDISRISDSEILISYKRGRSHALDYGAILEGIRFDTAGNQIAWRGELGSDPGLIQQMGEWIEFPDGSIGNYVDLQHVKKEGGSDRHHRVGTHWTRTTDKGRTFSPMTRMGLVDGVEYGYIFDGTIVDGKTYMLAMTFPELTESKSALNEKGGRIYGTVSALVSADNGGSWQHVRNLNQEFGGVNLNECALIVHGDGFIVCSRSYGSVAGLHRVDADFKLLEQKNLTTKDGIIRAHVGRPRLFWKDGSLYLIGRNNRGGPMELALFRVNPETLDVERFVVLDPQQEGTKIGDGYYAVPYFQETPQGTMFNVITYRRMNDQKNSDIVRLEYKWDEVR